MRIQIFITLITIIIKYTYSTNDCTTMSSTGDDKVILALPWRKFPANLSHGEFHVGGKPVVVHEKPNSGKGTGLTVWDGSLCLA